MTRTSRKSNARPKGRAYGYGESAEALRAKAEGRACGARATVTMIALLLALGAAQPLFAAQPPASPQAQEGFVPVKDLPAREQLPAAPLVMAAYAVAWVAVFGFIWSVWSRLGRVERDLAEVGRRIDKGARR